jgi:DNA-binding NtrC family response regulator
MNELAKHEQPLVLIVDDVPENIQVLASTLSHEECRIAPALGGKQAIKLLEQLKPSIVLLDIMMPEVDGMQVLDYIRENYPNISTVMITAKNDTQTIVESIKNGAEDFISKPLDPIRTQTVVRNLLKYHKLFIQHEHMRIHGGVKNPEFFKDIITTNPGITAMFQYVEMAVQSYQPVLITGETGVGKELMARAIHKAGKLPGEFVAVNVAGLDDTLFSDTLFGHLKGAYTGAEGNRGGLIDQATRGTLFLDEIGDLSSGNQVKLLRLLQEKEYFPVGSDQVKQTDARIVLATHRNLEELVESGRFRQDLYFRLVNHIIHMPPLRENKQDIPILLDHFLQEAAVSMSKKVPTYPTELPILLKTYHFPGNVRELRGMVYEAVIRHKGRMLSMQTFKDYMDKQRSKSAIVHDSKHANTTDDSASFLSHLHPLPTMKELTSDLILEAMKRANGNQEIAANQVGLSRPALYQRLRRGGLLKKVEEELRKLRA